MKKKDEIQGLVTAEGYRNYARHRFLWCMRSLDPRPLIDLRDNIFDPFIGRGGTLINGPFDAPLTPPQRKLLKELPNLVTAWQERWNLVESGSDGPWLNDWAIRNAMRHWQQVSDRMKSLLSFTPFSQDEPIMSIPKIAIDPFIRRDDLSDVLFIPFQKDYFLDRACRRLRQQLDRYCDAATSQLSEFKLIPFKDIKTRDLIWSVGWQISGESLSSLGDHPARMDQKGPRRLYKPGEEGLHRSIEFEHYNRATVMRAVRKTLKLVGIEKRRGR